MNLFSLVLISSSIPALLFSNTVSAQKTGTVKQNFLPSLPITIEGKTIQTKITLDANWRWVHGSGGYQSCFDSDWNKQFCPDPITCAKNCELEGVEQADYGNTYGISTSSSALTLKYLTGSNVGSRVYIVNSDGQTYYNFKLLNKQFSFTVDVSKVPCGLNGAVYFVDMPLDGGKKFGMPGAAYGTGYGDAQCPKDIKYINGYVNTNKTGACANEMDIWEANSQANAYTPHTCSIDGVYACTDAKTCGDGANRYNGVCDKDGADFNPYRAGQTTFYGFGSGFTVDTSKPFTVNTQFITDNGQDSGNLVKITRTYTQNGKTVFSHTMDDASIIAQKKAYGDTNHFGILGGMKRMGQALKNAAVLVLSLWDDTSVNMYWLDSTFPQGSTAAGAKRGPCGTNGGVWDLRSKNPNAQVIYSDIKITALSSGGPTPTPSPVPTPPVPSPVPTPNPPTPSGGCKVNLVCSCSLQGNVGGITC